jgi:predicted nucleic acid-binding Zn ribbon protein
MGGSIVSAEQDRGDRTTSGPPSVASPVTGLSTDRGGKPPSDVDSELPPTPENGQTADLAAPDGQQPVDNPAPDDLVRSALTSARGIARGPGRGRGRAGGRRGRRNGAGDRNRGGYSGPGPDPARDPQRIGQLLDGYVAERGWQRPLAEARVFAEWPALVGADVAAHCVPQNLHEGELRVAAETTAWATQLRLLASTLLARLVAELGPNVVTKLVITGPVAPSWKHGGWSVRGARGPRDTYG